MNKPFTILTESGLRYHRLKRWILRIGGKILGRKIYGPMSVYYSLMRGLEELKKNGEDIEYNVNPPTNKIHKTVIVLMGKDTLEYAIQLKKRHIIKTIFAGPAISVPTDHDDIFFDKEIDSILVPSQWVMDYFTSLQINKPERVHVRPSGVEDTGISEKQNNQIILYKKTCPEELYQNICSELDRIGLQHQTLHYGSFQFQEYQNLLNTSSGMIYLQESESQGLALQEAWIKDIPTLVRDRGYRTYDGKKRRSSSQISCPWMTKEYGTTCNEINLISQIHLFIDKLPELHPRQHLQYELTDKGSSELLLHLLNTHEHYS